MIQTSSKSCEKLTGDAATPVSSDRIGRHWPFTEARLAPQLDPGTNDVPIASLRMPAILVHRLHAQPRFFQCALAFAVVELHH